VEEIMPQFYLFLADAILIAHAVIIAFNVTSLPLIWLGYFRKWRFVHNFSFRTIHLVMIGYVVVQAVADKICPLTNWENDLRIKAGADANYAGSFIAHWVRRVIFYEADERVFTAAYIIFFALVVVTFFWIRPNPPRWWRTR
jgi:hypothetical protein